MPSINELQKWDNFINNPIDGYPQETTNALRQFWCNLLKQLPNVPLLPGVVDGEEESSLLLVWDIGEHKLDVEVLPNGSIFWFFINRTTKQVEGTDDKPIITIPKRIIELFQEYFMEEK